MNFFKGIVAFLFISLNVDVAFTQCTWQATIQGSLVGCNGQSVTLVAVPLPAPSENVALSYKWTRSGTTVGTARTFNTTTPGNFKVEISLQTGGCKKVSSEVQVAFSSNPNLEFPFLSGNPVVGSGGSYVACGNSILLSGSTTTPDVNFSWTKNGAPISGANSISYLATSAGNYVLKVTNQAGCFVSKGVNISFQSNPDATITSASATTFCQGGR